MNARLPQFPPGTLKNSSVPAGNTASYGDIGIARTFFGPDYEGISVVAMPELDSGNSPFTVYFNAEEKKGVTKLEIYQEIKGTQNAQVKAIQDAAKKLAARFPLNLMPLEKCASEKSASPPAAAPH